ncbi:MAG TPA: nucleotidyltransferase domain-containing protein [Silvibacterium sp.]|nr:nucleotidyltransferase domain-containing protein [Silvibacterium sp.]
MDAQIEQQREELVRLCRLYYVQRLAIFGSALREDFYSQNSDFDFLVEFQPLPPGKYADAYFGLMEGLETLFRRPVDLVVESAIKNPYFLKSVQQSKTSLYAA